MMQTEDYKRELISILFAQKHLIFWVALAIFVGAVMIANFWPSSYAATGEILVSGKQMTVPNPEALESSSVIPRDVSKEDLTSELEILRSPEVIEKALTYLAVERPGILGGKEAPDHFDIFAVSSSLETSIVPSSNVIKVAFRDREPAFSSEFVNTLMEQYIIQRARFFKGASQGVSPKLLQDQIDRYLEQLRENEERLLALVESTGVAAPEQEIANNIILKKKLQETLGGLVNELIDKKAVLSNLERATEVDDIKYFAFLGSGTIRELSAKLADLLAERGQAGRTYLPESTVIRNIDEQIETTSAALRAEVMAFRRNAETDIAAAEEKIEKLRAAVAEFDKLNVTLEGQIIETGKIERESALILSSLETISQRKEEVTLNRSMEADDGTSRYVTILSRAITPVRAAFPKPELVIPLGLIIGLLAGCTLGFLREYFDHTFKTPADVQMYSGLPVLFSLAKPQNSVLSMVYLAVIAALLILVFGFLVWQHVIKGLL
jgi:uncharacterized protein involved in exopolysaccharide biosynthesis